VAKPKIATIPMGCRWISRGWGMGWICDDQKTKAYIVGSICMDMLMVDVRNQQRRRCCFIFGENPTGFFNRRKLNTIPYEILN
jgi:alanine racemase